MCLLSRVCVFGEFSVLVVLHQVSFGRGGHMLVLVLVVLVLVVLLLVVLVLVLLPCSMGSIVSVGVSLVVPSRVVRRHPHPPPPPPPPHHPMCRRHLSGHKMSPEETLVMMIMLTMTIWRSFVSNPRRRRLRLLLVTVRLWHSGNLTPCTQDTGNSCAAQRHSACRG